MKRSVYSVLTAILCTILMLPLVTVPAAAYGLQGDLNGDDSITAADADVLCGFLCGETDLPCSCAKHRKKHRKRQIRRS